MNKIREKWEKFWNFKNLPLHSLLSHLELGHYFDWGISWVYFSCITFFFFATFWMGKVSFLKHFLATGTSKKKIRLHLKNQLTCSKLNGACLLTGLAPVIVALRWTGIRGFGKYKRTLFGDDGPTINSLSLLWLLLLDAALGVGDGGETLSVTWVSIVLAIGFELRILA